MSTIISDKKADTKLNQLEQIKKLTKVVADTADFTSIREFKPQAGESRGQQNQLMN